MENFNLIFNFWVYWMEVIEIAPFSLSDTHLLQGKLNKNFLQVNYSWIKHVNCVSILFLSSLRANVRQ